MALPLTTAQVSAVTAAPAGAAGLELHAASSAMTAKDANRTNRCDFMQLHMISRRRGRPVVCRRTSPSSNDGPMSLVQTTRTYLRLAAWRCGAEAPPYLLDTLSMSTFQSRCGRVTDDTEPCTRVERA